MISMSFVESGDLTFPSAGDSSQAQSRIAAANIETAAVKDFAKVFTVDGTQDFVPASAAANLATAMNYVASGSVPGLDALGYANNAVSTIQSAVSLLGDPLNLGLQVAGCLGISELANSGLQWIDLGQSLIRLATSSVFAAPSSPMTFTPSRQQAYINAGAINALVRQVVLA